MQRFYLALFAGLAVAGLMNATGRCDCGCGNSGPAYAGDGESCGCGDHGCPEPYCCDHTCNSGWNCGGGCSCCGSRPCCGLFSGLFPGRNACDWRRWSPCDACGGTGSCGCGESCGCQESCGRHESCGCTESCGCHEPCGCHESCGCESSCGCNRCGLFPCLFPWLRCERCKGAGEQYGACSQCGCGELYLGDWRSQPPRCEPCNCCGNWVGPGEPMPSYQMPPRYGSVYYGAPSNGPMYQGRGTDDSMPMTAPPSSPPPTSPPPSNPPVHTTQRPGSNWSNY
jgi:hypothetical protein